MAPDFWVTLAAALGLTLVIEGLLYALFPGPMRRALALVLDMEEAPLRITAIVTATIGVGVVWLVLG